MLVTNWVKAFSYDLANSEGLLDVGRIVFARAVQLSSDPDVWSASVVTSDSQAMAGSQYQLDIEESTEQDAKDALVTLLEGGS